MNRELTEQEKNWLIIGLKTLETGESLPKHKWINLRSNKPKKVGEPLDLNFLFAQVEELRVVNKCNCGEPTCHTVSFQHFEGGKSTAIVSVCTEDNRMLIIHLNRETGLLSKLQII